MCICSGMGHVHMQRNEASRWAYSVRERPLTGTCRQGMPWREARRRMGASFLLERTKLMVTPRKPPAARARSTGCSDEPRVEPRTPRRTCGSASQRDS